MTFTKTGVTEKKRELCYSAHIDRYIFQYYGYKLNQIYNDRVKKDNIHNAAIAYRDNLHQNNIHFAKRAMDFIRQRRNCYVIIGDFTSYFDSLDHVYLKRMLCNLLNTNKLPNDYYAVFKNITKYSIWNLESLLELNELPNNRKGISQFNLLDVALSTKRFRELKKSNVIPNKRDYGIPQGSAISAVLSNIYMLMFDKQINDFVTKNHGLYMRYSDDFIVVLPKVSFNEFEQQFAYVNATINSIPRLVLESKKTQIYEFDNGNIKCINELVFDDVQSGKNLINYLGFTFDGSVVTIRDKTVSKYYYRLYRKLKPILKHKGITQKGNKISFKKLYEKYSIKGSKKRKGNFLTYAKRVEKIFVNEKGIRLISKNHMQKIRKKLNQLD